MRPVTPPEPRFMRAPSAGARPSYLRRDPAPSRLAFRLQRLWLTPTVRAFTRIGAPIFGVTLLLGLWLGDPGRRADLVSAYDDTKISLQNRPEFLINRLDVTGASPEVADAVKMMLPVGLPASRFAIDLNAYHDAITRLDAVSDVAVVVRPGGVLEAKISEREPVLLWRTPAGVEMLDATGHRVASLTRRDARPDLALVTGDGADQVVPEALSVLSAARPILTRTRGLVRIGERRWDVVLAGGRRIELPEKDPARALTQMLAVDAKEDLLGRDFTRIDLRDPARPTVRLSANALEVFEEVSGQKPQTAGTLAKLQKPATPLIDPAAPAAASASSGPSGAAVLVSGAAVALESGGTPRPPLRGGARSASADAASGAGAPGAGAQGAGGAVAQLQTVSAKVSAAKAPVVTNAALAPATPAARPASASAAPVAQKAAAKPASEPASALPSGASKAIAKPAARPAAGSADRPAPRDTQSAQATATASSSPRPPARRPDTQSSSKVAQ